MASTVSPALGRDLSLEAAGGKLKVIGGEGGLSVEGGFSGGSEGVEILSNADIHLESQTGSVSEVIQVKSIKTPPISRVSPLWCAVHSLIHCINLMHVLSQFSHTSLQSGMVMHMTYASLM